MSGFSDKNIRKIYDPAISYMILDPPGGPPGYSWRIPISEIYDSASVAWPTTEIVCRLWDGVSQLYLLISSDIQVIGSYVYIQPGSMSPPFPFVDDWGVALFRVPDPVQNYDGQTWNSLTPQGISSKLDLNTRLSQRAIEMASRSLQVDPFDDTVIAFTGKETQSPLLIPPATNRQNALLGFSADGLSLALFAGLPATPSSVTPVPGTVMLRDASGRSQVEDPVANKDVVNKQYLEAVSSYVVIYPATSDTLTKGKSNRIAPGTRTVVLPVGAIDGEFVEIDATEAGVEITQITANDLVRMPGNGGSTKGTSGKTIIPPGFFGELRFVSSWFSIVAPVKIADPGTLPTGSGADCAWSPDGKYLAVTHSITPFITIYDFTTGSLVKIADPATLPASSGNGVCWSPDSRYLAVAHNTTPFITIYDFTTGAPVKITNPASLPGGNSLEASWSPDGKYLAVATGVSSPFITIYDFTTGAPVKIADPGTLPTGSGFAVDWSPDSRYLAVGHGTTPFITIYDFITGVPVKITNPGSLPASTGLGVEFDPTGRFLAVGHNTTPFITIYDFITGAPVKITDPGTLPANSSSSPDFSWSGRFLVLPISSTPFITIYDFITGAPVKIADPATLPTGNTQGASFSPDDRYLAVAHLNTPFVTIYDWAVAASNAWKLIPTRMLPGGSGITPISPLRAFNTYLFYMRTLFR